MTPTARTSEAKEASSPKKHELFADVNDRIVQLGLIINGINAVDSSTTRRSRQSFGR